MITIRSGQYKNKKLLTPDSDVRPTSDKIRQAIFNILAHADFAPELEDARVLDAFAGTGALGLEALARGAKHAWFMENNPGVRKILTQNLALAADRATLLAVDACAPPYAAQTMHIVFLDPPYGKDLLPPAVTALQAVGWIDNKTLLVLESDAKETISLPEEFTFLGERKYGRTVIRFAQLRC